MLARALLPEVRLVVASDSLQYAPDVAATWHGSAGLRHRGSSWRNSPWASTTESFVVLQRPDAYGYATEYLGRVVNRRELLERAIEAGLVLDREFVAPGAIDAVGAPERPAYLRSFLFRRP